MGEHDGHRKRLRKNFIERGGLYGFSDLNALELLLFYAISRQDTNILAHRLLDKFDTLHGVLTATEQELKEVEGVGDSTAVLLRLVLQIARRSEISKTKDIRAILSSSDAGRYCMPRFMYEEDEVVLMLCLDAKRRIIKCAEVGRGMANAVESNLRLITETALRCKACAVVIAHNHPDGIALPSPEDNAATKQLIAALEPLGVEFVDHIIVAGEDFISYADSGMLPLFKGGALSRY